jgi:hypothetical protein
MSPLYLYALTDAADAAPLGRGLAGEPLERVRAGALTAVIGRQDAPCAPTADTLRAHDGVVRALAEGAPALLPARFGAVASDEGELRAALAEREDEYAAALERVRGREQMTARVFSSSGAPERVPDGGAAAGGPGARYLARRAGEGGAAGVPGLAGLLARLSPLVAGEIVERHDAAPLVASVYHLVARGTSDRYRNALDAAARDWPALRVVASGPWPPYAFAAWRP